ncbi:unnamed protein product, partial [Polarella glacialis]
KLTWKRLASDSSLAVLGATLPRSLRQLQLDFTFCQHITDAGVAALAANLSSSLQQLQLDFTECSGITDAGLAALAANLSSSLQQLQLDFTKCRLISDAGLAALAANLPNSLQQLHLNFFKCRLISDAGLAALAANLPSSLPQLQLNIEWCAKISDAGLAALGANLPNSLLRLQVDLTLCDKISDAGLAALAANLPSSLQQFQLQLGGWLPTSVSPDARRAAEAGPESLRAWAAAVEPAAPWHGQEVTPAPPAPNATLAGPTATSALLATAAAAETCPDGLIAEIHSDNTDVGQLEFSFVVIDTFRTPLFSALGFAIGLGKLSLDFTECHVWNSSNFSDADLAALAASLPISLQQLQLDFTKCRLISDAGLAALAANLPNSLQQLQLNFTGCQKISDAGLAALAANLPSSLQQLQFQMVSHLNLGVSVKPSRFSFLSVGDFVKEKWQLEKEQAIPLKKYRDWEGDECIFNKTSFKDALTGTSRETIWFQVYLSWADRFNHRPWTPSSRSRLCAELSLSLRPPDSDFGEDETPPSRLGLRAACVDRVYAEAANLHRQEAEDLLSSLTGPDSLHDLKQIIDQLFLGKNRIHIAQLLEELFGWSAGSVQRGIKAQGNLAFPFQGLIPKSEERGISYPQLVRVEDQGAGVCPNSLLDLARHQGNVNLYHLAPWRIQPVLIGGGRPSEISRVWCAYELSMALIDDTREKTNAPSLCSASGGVPEAGIHVLTDGLTETEIEVRDSSSPELAETLKEIGSSSPELAETLKSLREMCFPIHVMKAGMDLLLQEAQATEPADRRHILNKLQLDFTFCQHITDAGVAALAANLSSSLQQLQLDFTECSGITDAGLAALAANLSSSLQQLQLDFTKCRLISDAGLAALAANLPSSLPQLQLNIEWCAKISDAGLAALGANLPNSLLRLQVDLTLCDKISDAGLAALAANLPSSLQQFQLQLGGWLPTSVSPDARRAAEAGPESLRAWAAAVEPAAPWHGQEVTPAPPAPNATLAGPTATSALLATAAAAETCPDGLIAEIHSDNTDVGQLEFSFVVIDTFRTPLFSALGFAIGLGKLSLDFTECHVWNSSNFSDADLAALAASLPISLQQLQLDFTKCRLISDAGLAALAANLPNSLQQLQLNFTGCQKISDAGLAALAANLPSSLQQLQFQCYGI